LLWSTTNASSDTGVDLVHAQLEQALNPQGSALKATPSARGHAIEVRLYAEDAAQGFRPTPGRVERLKWPTGPGVRVDSGIEEGQNVGTSFDSMLGKLIVHAPTRAVAVARIQDALAETAILGLGTNQAYLRAISRHPAVIEGKVHTGFLGEAFADFAPVAENAPELGLLAAARAAGLGRHAVSSGSAAPALASPFMQVKYP
jgi:acetyl/propionyl-CoA carboxylase alpha subunit